MEYQHLVKDFVKRTKHNLETLRSLQAERPELEIFEVTQLVNCLLGLLVFPQQRYFQNIQNFCKEDLEELGWPIPRVIGEFPQVRDLHQLLRYLRNSIAHFNIEFKCDESFQLNGLEVWNFDPRKREITWKAEMNLDEVEQLVDKFIELILTEEFSKR